MKNDSNYLGHKEVNSGDMVGEKQKVKVFDMFEIMARGTCEGV